MMKKNLLTVGFLSWALAIGAQTVVFHVDPSGVVYVGKNALVYNGGGLQTKGNAVFENHGNVMVNGNGTTDVFRTIDGSNAVKTELNGGGNFINKLNEPTLYASHNSTDPLIAPVYTYGQLYVTGISQTNISGIVDQEFRQVNHGDYQQIGLPFFGKSFSTLAAELGKTSPFSTTRYSHNEILNWNNKNVVFDNLSSLSLKIGDNLKPYTYYILGGNGLDVASTTRTLKGRPVSDAVLAEREVKLENAGDGINFGVGGNSTNAYNEKYNTYLQDNFSVTASQAWLGDFGKNYYQFGNPYLTNLDLSQIARTESASTGDGNNLSNIYGVRLEVSGVQHVPNLGGGSANFKSITYGSGVPVGDVEYQVVRPFGAFAIKLNDNTLKPNFDFSTLRRFKYHPRDGATSYSVTSAKGGASASTVKQLGIIGVDTNGNEIERTYYVVGDNTVSGASTQVKAQVGAFAGQQFGSYEEDAVNGGYDNNNFSYWLYINEANENDFKGKNIKVVNYNPNIVGFKFEIRENAGLVDDATHLLSQGEGFYYKKESESTVHPVLQNAVVSSVAGNQNGVEYNFYYGEPQITLGAGSVKKSSTIVVYNPEKDNYFVLIDSTWKTADIQVYDMSGKLVNTVSKVSSKERYELPLNAMKAGYVVHITSDKGEKVITKILR